MCIRDSLKLSQCLLLSLSVCFWSRWYVVRFITGSLSLASINRGVARIFFNWGSCNSQAQKFGHAHICYSNIPGPARSSIAHVRAAVPVRTVQYSIKYERIARARSVLATALPPRLLLSIKVSVIEKCTVVSVWQEAWFGKVTINPSTAILRYHLPVSGNLNCSKSYHGWVKKTRNLAAICLISLGLYL